MDSRSSWTEWLRFRVQDIYPRHIFGLRKALDECFGYRIQGFVSERSLDLWIQGKCDGSAFACIKPYGLINQDLSNYQPVLFYLAPLFFSLWSHCFTELKIVPENWSQKPSNYLPLKSFFFFWNVIWWVPLGHSSEGKPRLRIHQSLISWTIYHNLDLLILINASPSPGPTLCIITINFQMPHLIMKDS